MNKDLVYIKVVSDCDFIKVPTKESYLIVRKDKFTEDFKVEIVDHAALNMITFCLPHLSLGSIKDPRKREELYNNLCMNTYSNIFPVTRTYLISVLGQDQVEIMEVAALNT